MLAYMTYDVSTVLLLLVLLVAAITDLRRHRVPNWLTFGAFFGGIILQASFLGWGGVTTALSGAGIGLLFLIPFYLTGGMGAGDAKLMAGVGTVMGFQVTMFAAAFALCLAGLYALILICMRGEWTSFMQRYAVAMRTKHYVTPDSKSIAGHRFPFAVAIGGGTLISLWWHSQLEFYHLTTQIGYQLKAWGGAGL
jgi:prepilin peptidase CpaA